VPLGRALEALEAGVGTGTWLVRRREEHVDRGVLGEAGAQP
jgi:hypothetical protein